MFSFHYKLRCVPPCVAKTCAVPPVFARVAGKFRREGANREKLTVKKSSITRGFFFSPFASLINREKSA